MDSDKENEEVVDTEKAVLQETEKKIPNDDATKKATLEKKTTDVEAPKDIEVKTTTKKKAVAETTGKRTAKKTAEKKIKSLDVVDPEVVEKKCWKYIYDINSVSEERLNRVAMIDLKREYTYRQMFRNWEKYAEVFSALDITADNHSRLAIFDCCAVESSFAIYAADMTGASIVGFSPYFISDKYPLDNAIKKEKITDLFLNDLVATDKMLIHFLKKKKELGIRNIIVVRIPIDSDEMDPKVVELSNQNYKALRKVQGVLFMEDLLVEHEATPIKYGPNEFKDDAFILHTSGTTKGISKPVPLSDIALNAAAENAKISGVFKQFEDGAVSMCMMIAMSVYGLVNQLHEPLAFGCTVVIPPMAFNNECCLKAIKQYNVNILLTTPYFFELWSKAPKEYIPDFSSVKCIVIGGAYLSAQAKKQYKKIVQENGGNPEFINGYGMSETCGACIIQAGDSDTDSIGFPLPGVSVKIYDENDEKYYDIKDKHTGVLYISSQSISKGKIDGESYFELEEIDGIPYVCTNDVVGVNEDGSLSCQGRANRYFVNNDGIKFNAGIVETSIAAEPGIKECVIVPWYDKLITHDTVPVLYVQTYDKVKKIETVRNALIHVFITNQKFKETNLPMQVVFVDEIPHNGNGKVDIYKITNGGISGKRYFVRPTRNKGELIDVRLEFVENKDALLWNGETPSELTSVVQDVMNTAHDETVLNKSCNLMGVKMMRDIAKLKMKQNAPMLKMLEQFMPGLEKIGTQTYNFVSQFFTMMQEMNEKQRQYMEELSERTDKFPQMPYMPYMPYMQDVQEEESMQSDDVINPMANYMPMFAPLFMSGLENIGTQTYNFVSQFFTMIREMNEKQKSIWKNLGSAK